MIHLHNGIICSRKKEEGIPTLWDSMDRTEDYYAKWNKPGGERQIPYDLTYKSVHKESNEQNKLMSRTEPETWKRATDWWLPEEMGEGGMVERRGRD